MEQSRPLALITGGTSGIGLGAALQLAQDHDLALGFAEDHNRAQSAVDAIRKISDTKVTVFPGVLTNFNDAERLVKAVKQEFGRGPAVLINSSGRIRDTLFLNSDFDSHQLMIQEHLLVTMALCHLTLKDMYRQRFGRIINLSSISARFSKRGQSSYAAAKAGVEAFTRTLAIEVAHRGITVNAIAPGLIETPMTKDVLSKIIEKHGDFSQKIPVGYVGTPEDVGNLISFLCSTKARYITGAVHVIDGGRSLGDPG